jgi:hypothetical protein
MPRPPSIPVSNSSPYSTNMTAVTRASGYARTLQIPNFVPSDLAFAQPHLATSKPVQIRSAQYQLSRLAANY